MHTSTSSKFKVSCVFVHAQKIEGGEKLVRPRPGWPGWLHRHCETSSGLEWAGGPYQPQHESLSVSHRGEEGLVTFVMFSCLNGMCNYDLMCE